MQHRARSAWSFAHATLQEAETAFASTGPAHTSFAAPSHMVQAWLDERTLAAKPGGMDIHPEPTKAYWVSNTEVVIILIISVKDLPIHGDMYKSGVLSYLYFLGSSLWGAWGILELSGRLPLLAGMAVLRWHCKDVPAKEEAASLKTRVLNPVSPCGTSQACKGWASKSLTSTHYLFSEGPPQLCWPGHSCYRTGWPLAPRSGPRPVRA